MTPQTPPARGKHGGPRDRSVYFRAYYEAHRETILAKNRRWWEAHKARTAELRRERTARLRRDRERPPAEPPPVPPSSSCVDCGAPTVTAPRCRNCYQRHRYATDPLYRAQRLATSRRWQHKQARG